MTVPYSFGTATSAIPLSQLDSNFNTPITLGNTAIQLGNTVTTLNNMTLANVTISSGNVTITNVSVTTANVTTGNITNLVTGNAVVTGGSVNGTPVGNGTASTGAFTTLSASSTVTLSGGTANAVAYLNASKVVTTGSALTFDGTNFGISAGSGVSVKNISSATQANLRLGSTFTTGTGGANTDWSLIQSYAVYGDLVFRSGTAEGDDPRTTGSTRFQFLRDGTSIWSVGGSESMRLTSTGLGIGTSSPSSKLQVNGNLRVEGATSEILMAVGAERTISASGSASSTALTFKRWNGSTYVNDVVMDGSGNLGLGVTPSAWSIRALQVGSGFAAWSTGNTNARIFANTYYDGAYKYVGTGRATQYEQDGYHAWFTAASGTAGNAITFTQAMTLDASGNLGIGTTSPGSYSSKTLQVTGSSTDVAIKLTNTTTGSGSGAGFDFELNGNDINYVNRTATGVQKFWTNATERARIDSSGNLLVGTTAQQTGGNGKLSVAGGSSVAATLTNNSAGSAYTTEIFNYTTSTGGGVGRYVKFAMGATPTQTGSIIGDGTNTAYNTSSDYRLKENIVPMTGALELVKKQRPVTWTWKSNGKSGKGFIAHWLQEDGAGECVTGQKDAVDEKGNPDYQGVDTSFLVATLTAAIQEQQALIQTLTERITALESK